MLAALKSSLPYLAALALAALTYLKLRAPKTKSTLDDKVVEEAAPFEKQLEDLAKS